MGTAQAIESYRDLQVWKAAVDLAVDCYQLTRQFPASEMYGMTSQIRRSSAAIAANIAEGYGRDSTPGFIQFLRIAQGSLKEVETHLVISTRVGLISGDSLERSLKNTEEIGKMLRSLIRRLQDKS